MGAREQQLLSAVETGVNAREQAAEVARRIGVPEATVHFFLCTGPDCCSPEFGLAVWRYLKSRSRELEQQLDGGRLLRSKVACLRICRGLGPTMAVYPSGRWYCRVDERTCERILRHELFGEGDLSEHRIAQAGFATRMGERQEPEGSPF